MVVGAYNILEVFMFGFGLGIAFTFFAATWFVAANRKRRNKDN